MPKSCVVSTVFSIVVSLFAAGADGQDQFLHTFDRIQLTDTYYSEGANFGDIDGDKVADVAYGPYWFRGPDYKEKYEIFPAKPQNVEAYANCFFSWIYDFDGDGKNDVLTAGFPGTPAYVYRNPGKEGLAQPWPKHEVFDQVSNEAPQFLNVVGDERPELLCARDGFYGYATIDWQKPLEKWTYHIVSERIAPTPFGHGLGAGDVNGDKRSDILCKDGWLEQPESLKGDPQWTFHKVQFAGPGGAEMYAYDVDGDGDNDVITSLEAHSYGLAWHEQVQEDGNVAFKQHLVMGRTPAENKYGVLFTEPHTVALADIDGDGLKDIVTGKTYYSHHKQSPLWDAGAVVYWFRLVRGKDGVDYVPYKADGEAGVGRQLSVGDVNGDKLPDIVVGGMKGCHVLIHKRETVNAERFKAGQPKALAAMKAGLTPEEAAEHMTVPDGFTVQVAAAEPLVHQPIAFCIDDRGRIWVAEAYTYPTRAPEGQGKDKILILEDTNGDGTLDSRKVFAERLNLVSGLEVGFGGAWVGAAPYLLFIPDKDGDDKPDGPPEVLLDGFGYHDTHETLNAFIWGPDGWLYGCHGVFTHSRVGKPGTPDKERVPINAGIWRYHPTMHQFEVFAQGTSNPWGVDFDENGQAFCTACVIPHLYHVIQGGRYQRQAGTHFNDYTFDDIKTIADHAHYAGDIREHAWWGHEPTELSPGVSAAGGGHAHCGAMIYLGDNWPADYRKGIYMNNVHGNRVNCDILEREGSGFVGHHGKDFLLANDHWFRGINLKYGPDGSVYLSDWYDKNACHRPNPEIWDRTNGRIYKISYGQPTPVQVDLGKADDVELIKLMRHPNEWYVRVARRILQERGPSEALPQLLERAFDLDLSTAQMLRRLFLLHVTGGFSEEIGLKLLSHKDEYLRAWTIQLQLEDRSCSAEFLSKLAAMAKEDPSPVVRLYLASALQRLPVGRRWEIAAALAAHAEDAKDHNLPLMYWYGIEPLVAADPARAVALGSAAKVPLLTRYVIRRAASDEKLIDAAVAALAATKETDRQLVILNEMLAAFEGRVNLKAPPAWSGAYETLLASDSDAVRDRADQVAILLGDKRILPRMRERLADDKAGLDKRREALEILLRGRDPDAAPAFQAVVNVPELRGQAIRALSAYDDAKTPAAVLGVYGKLNEAERRDAVGTLVSRPAFAVALLDAIKAGRVPRTDLHAYHVRQLLSFKDDSLTKRLVAEWGQIRETAKDKTEHIVQLKAALTPERLAQADLSNGRRIYAKSCANCHVLFGDGQKVGPDITGSNRANLDYLLENLIDPSAVLGQDYRMTVLRLGDGRVVQGLVLKETDSAVTVRTINDTVVIAKGDIDERELSALSLMPEGQLKEMKPEEVRDLVAYLASPTQVALKGPAAPIDPKTKKVPGAIEGETIKVLARTAGSTGSQKMQEFQKDRWSGDDHLWWTGAGPGAKLELELPVEKAGTYDLELVLTKARDYGIVQLSLDGQAREALLGGPIDLYNFPDVITTGVLAFEGKKLAAGSHKLGVQIVGAHPKAVPAHMFGLDYVRLVKPKDAEGK
ncbi:MAG: FG-GAP repeat protein [Planctomycetia bacterium]|nr:FG-GAP repeat protein [Planctomycetia bacterium]